MTIAARISKLERGAAAEAGDDYERVKRVMGSHVRRPGSRLDATGKREDATP